MTNSPCFLVVDFHAESRFLLVKTLLRKFPGATIHECDEVERSLELVQAGALTAVVAHRTFDVSGAEVVRRCRAADPSVPIVMVSGMDRRLEALEAGASSFLSYEEWLRIGSVVEAHMNDFEARVPETSPDRSDFDRPRGEADWVAGAGATDEKPMVEAKPAGPGANVTP